MNIFFRVLLLMREQHALINHERNDEHMSRRISTYTFDEFVHEFRARRNDNDDVLHTCTNEHHARDVATMRRDAFNNDKSQRTNLCVWCRYCEMTYNNAYTRALTACNEYASSHDIDIRITSRARINDIDDVTMRDTLHTLFDDTMRDVRSRRYARRNNDVA